MSGLEHLSISLFPMLLLVILYFTAWSQAPYLRSNRLLRWNLLAVAEVLLLDSLCWLMDGCQLFWLTRAANLIYFAAAVIPAPLWLLYVYSKLNSERSLLDQPQFRRLLLLPLAAYAAMVVTTPWTGLLFTLDAAGCYQRGPLFFLPYLMMTGYHMAGSVCAAWYARRETLPDARRECWLLIFYGVFPLAGILMQVGFFQWWLIWPFNALSLLMVCMGQLNRRITVDALTGLNNRRRLDQYLQAKCQSATGWYLIMMDIDKLKSINDRWGHGVGDLAIQEAARLIKTIFGRKGAFLARYGGDEFAIAMEGTDPQVQGLIETLQAAAADCKGEDVPYTLELSAGYTYWNPKKPLTCQQLIAAADAQMYLRKRERTARKAKGEGAQI